MTKKKAFTLAEIIVTLMLIGVISAIIIPFLHQEFSKQRWTITFKRSFAETFNALTRVALEEDCNKSLTCTNIFSEGQVLSTKKLGDALTSVMAVSRNCQTNQYSDCFSHEVRVGLGEGAKQTLKATMADQVSFESNFYTFVTTRGVSYAVLGFGMQCLNQPHPQNLNQQYIDAYVFEPTNPKNQMLSLCGFIILDVNGNQRPNVWGRDVFGMWITDRSVLGVYPFGGYYDYAFRGKCNSNSSKDSLDTRGCAAELIQNGWVMKY